MTIVTSVSGPHGFNRYEHYKVINARKQGGDTCTVQVELEESLRYVLTRFWATEKFTIAWDRKSVDELIDHLIELRNKLR